VHGELGGHRRLARALQADQHDDVWRLAGKLEPGRLAEDGDELFIDDLDHGLRRRQGGDDLGADGALADALDQVLDDTIVHVGLEERQSHLAQALVDVCLRKAPFAG
jgi:hypothetical protein